MPEPGSYRSLDGRGYILANPGALTTFGAVMDLISRVPAGRQVIERYGSSGFRISGVIWRGSVLVSPDFTQPWLAADAAAVTAQSLMPIVDHGGIEFCCSDSWSNVAIDA